VELRAFHRSFAPPEGIDREEIRAAFSNRVLTAPKTPAARQRTITVEPV
jgi:HSP20 family molecular chaperone IbpA